MAKALEAARDHTNGWGCGRVQVAPMAETSANAVTHSGMQQQASSVTGMQQQASGVTGMQSIHT